jgi:hypothetical protein
VSRCHCWPFLARTPIIGVTVLGLTLGVPEVKVGPSNCKDTNGGDASIRVDTRSSWSQSGTKSGGSNCKDTNGGGASIGADTGSSWSQSGTSSGGSNCKDSNGGGAS